MIGKCFPPPLRRRVKPGWTGGFSWFDLRFGVMPKPVRRMGPSQDQPLNWVIDLECWLEVGEWGPDRDSEADQ